MLMEKDFESWHLLKAKINAKENNKKFFEREIWWCHVGLNIGYEQDGKGQRFTRPVLIIKKHGERIFTICHLRSKIKEDNKFYYAFSFKDKKQSIILPQIKLIDSKRLVSKIGTISEEQFLKIKQKIRDFHFS